MTDDRDSRGGASDDEALDAWLAANFPPKTPDAVPPPEPPSAEPPLTVPTEPPPTVPPVSPSPKPPPLVEPAQPTPPVSLELPPVFPPPLTDQAPAAPPPGAWPSASGASQQPPPEPPPTPPVAGELAGLPPEPDVPADPTELFGAAGGASALDDLFGESKFRDYEVEPGPSQNPFAARPFDPRGLTATQAGEAAQPNPAGISRAQKVLLWIAGSLVAALALLALFLLGTRLPDLLGPAPAIVVTPSTTPTPTPTAAPLGPVDPGVYDWDELLGGECLDPYEGPWAEEYTVVDCAGPHPAQLATRGTFGPDDGFVTPYPGVEALQSQVNLLCTAPEVIDYAAARAYTDIQFEASFAATADDWVEGDRDYSCFLSRASGGPITGSIAMPQVAPEPSETPTP
ncbi:hypothetical protein GCM10022239_04220 [Leifsonia bigeumensis]|uniref:Septum formation-related domain-containing protein n=1 Tax=Leifsonella bigeumensis TaxID=433643 RepID=A0ABP7F6P8_9MICO